MCVGHEVDLSHEKKTVGAEESMFFVFYFNFFILTLLKHSFNEVMIKQSKGYSLILSNIPLYRAYLVKKIYFL